MRVVAIIQARMQSTRLPGKVLKRVLGKSLLGYMLERVQRCKQVSEIIVATTTKSADQAIVDYCQRLGVHCYRGSEDDVLSRYYDAALESAAEVVVRLTSDCPLMDPEVVDDMVRNFIAAQPNLDYMSNTISRSFPRGLDCEVFTFRVLEEAHNAANLPMEREHVTPYIYLRYNLFRVANYFSLLGDHSQYRLTVDYEEDFELISEIIKRLYPKHPQFTLKDVLQLLEQNPELATINSSQQQKLLHE